MVPTETFSNDTEALLVVDVLNAITPEEPFPVTEIELFDTETLTAPSVFSAYKPCALSELVFILVRFDALIPMVWVSLPITPMARVVELMVKPFVAPSTLSVKPFVV